MGYTIINATRYRNIVARPSVFSRITNLVVDGGEQFAHVIEVEDGQFEGYLNTDDGDEYQGTWVQLQYAIEALWVLAP